MTRPEILNAVLGQPWRANARGPDAFDCFHLAVHLQRALAGRELADVVLPAVPSWTWMMDAVASHPDHARWREVPANPLGLVRAGDLSLVLMARRSRAAHVGVWLKAEGGVIHADQGFGVVFDTLTDLRAKGWAKLRFYEPLPGMALT